MCIITGRPVPPGTVHNHIFRTWDPPPMRFLLLNTDYPSFLSEMYGRAPGLDRAPYEVQVQARNDTFFGVGDAYSRALGARGHEAVDVHLNNRHMQLAWARERGRPPALWRSRLPSFRLRRGIVPWLEFGSDHNWLVDVLRQQIADFKPEVILNHDIAWLAPEDLRSMAGPDCVLIGQHAASPWPAGDYTRYDLILSSWPPTIARMRAVGVRADHLGLAFDPRVLDHLGTPARDLPLTFIGSFSEVHAERTRFIEELSRARPDLSIYAPSLDGIRSSSPIRGRYVGPAFGIDMFRVLRRSQVTINHHGVRPAHANNMRLFEATGVGALLLTDAKPDLERYFIPGREVVTYTSVSEALAAIDRAVSGSYSQVAENGAARTNREHTWKHRIDDLLRLL